MSAAQQWAVRLTWPDGSVSWVARDPESADWYLDPIAAARAAFHPQDRAEAEASEWRRALFDWRHELPAVDVVPVERQERVIARRGPATRIRVCRACSGTGHDHRTCRTEGVRIPRTEWPGAGNR